MQRNAMQRDAMRNDTMHWDVLHAGAGVAFKPVHFDALIADLHRVDFIEIHAENYFGDGGLLHAQLTELRAHLPLSIHGVGLSLGGSDVLDRKHLQRLRHLCDRYAPSLVSEHLAWCMQGGRYFGDLLPMAYNENTLRSVASRVQQVQDVLGRQILIENPSAYLHLANSDMSESEFLRLLCSQTGCGLLLDINNLIVSCHNTGGDPMAYLANLPTETVGEIHLAGHTRVELAGAPFLIDEHASAVADITWKLYVEWLLHAGAKPCVIEWDRELPGWSALAADVDCARSLQSNPFMPPLACGSTF